MRISHIGFVVSKHLANAPQPLATNAQARELQSVRRRNNLQALHRPLDTTGKPQNLNPLAARFANIKTSVAERDAGGLIELARQIAPSWVFVCMVVFPDAFFVWAGGRAAHCSYELPLSKVVNLDRVIIGIRNEA